jgi:TolB protein
LKNPYVVDRPLTSQDLFFGRDAQFDRLTDLLNAGTRLFLLYGQRYVGKTSFLNQLPLRLNARYAFGRIEWAPPTGPIDLAWMVMCGAAATLGRTPPDKQAYEAQPGVYALGYVRSLNNGAADLTHVVCFDALPATAFPVGKAWQDALARLSAILEGVHGLAILLAIEGIPIETGLVEDLAILPQIVLGPLQEDDTEDLLMVPVRGTLAFDYQAARHVHRLTGGYPYFVQLFGHAIFEQRSAVGWASLPEVHRAINEVVAVCAPQFESLWEARSAAARIVLCAFAEMMGHYHGVAPGKDVGIHLARLGVQMPEEDISAALIELTAYEVLERLGGETFRFTNELLRHWVKQNHDTVDTVRQLRSYRRVRLRQAKPARRHRVDWWGWFLWVIAGLLVVLIALVWRSRQKGLVWTVAPTPTPAVTVAGPIPRPTTPPPTPDTGVPRGRIAYMAKERQDSTWEIYSMRSDGSDPTRLTQNDANDTLPASSPDGRRIAFVSDRDRNREIYVMNADGNEQINLTSNPSEDWTPAWSPDGKRIAFASFRDGNWEIYVMDSRGQNPTRLTKNNAMDFGPSWSPDGQRIAFVSNRDGNLEIYVMAADGSSQTRFTQHEATDQSPAWSPDGKQLLWESYRDGNMEIYAANLDGSGLKNVTRDPQADDHGPTWSPWGGRIAFFSNRDRGWDIYTLDLETGERVNLTMSPTQEQTLNWGR